MKKRLMWGIAWSVLATGTANAALLSRAGGQAYYDTTLGITWLADANHAMTSGYDADGRMDWWAAQDWIHSLNTAGFLGAADWRLPVTIQPDPTCSDQYLPGGAYSAQGYGYGCSGSEMGHLYHQYAGMLTAFTNVQPDFYWSDTLYAPDVVSQTQLRAWAFNPDPALGRQDRFDAIGTPFYAWAVRTGDIAVVPLPAAAWLLASALGMMGVLRRWSAAG